MKIVSATLFIALGLALGSALSAIAAPAKTSRGVVVEASAASTPMVTPAAYDGMQHAVSTGETFR